MEHSDTKLIDQLSFMSLQLYSRKARPLDQRWDEMPVIVPTIQSIERGTDYRMQDMPEVVFENFTAIFRFSNDEEILVHWPLKDYPVDKTAFVRFAMYQVTAIQAQLFKMESEIKLLSYDLSSRRLFHYGPAGQKYEEPTDDSTSEYAYNTERYTAPTSIFESIMRGINTGPYGLGVP